MTRKISLIIVVALLAFALLLSTIGYFLADPSTPRGAIGKAAILQLVAVIGAVVLLFVNFAVSNLLITIVIALLTFISVILELVILGKIADFAGARNCVIVAASLAFSSLFIIVLPLLECSKTGAVTIPLPPLNWNPPPQQMNVPFLTPP